MEGILLGTSKGGFTGAIDREGLFEQASGGTLLLDEISTMPYELQSKLLRVLQENYIRRVGGTKDIPIDVRIIATINEKAEDLISSGRLRQDLYYRLKIIEINIPPLRERKDDIIPLSFYFLNKYNIEFFKHFKGFSRGGKELLLNHDYPGNVRELQHMLMSAISMEEDGDLISEDHLGLPMESKIEKKFKSTLALNEQGLEKYMDSIEKELIIEAVENSGRHLSKAARQLGLKRQTLHYKLKKHDIKL
jgi:arginine utilization regulatory protein